MALHHAAWSMQLLVTLVFCLSVWFPSANKAAGPAQTAGRPEGSGPRGLN